MKAGKVTINQATSFTNKPKKMSAARKSFAWTNAYPLCAIEKVSNKVQSALLGNIRLDMKQPKELLVLVVSRGERLADNRHQVFKFNECYKGIIRISIGTKVINSVEASVVRGF